MADKDNQEKVEELSGEIDRLEKKFEELAQKGKELFNNRLKQAQKLFDLENKNNIESLRALNKEILKREISNEVLRDEEALLEETLDLQEKKLALLEEGSVEYQKLSNKIKGTEKSIKKIGKSIDKNILGIKKGEEKKNAIDGIISSADNLLGLLNLSATAYDDSIFGMAEKVGGFGNLIKIYAEQTKLALQPQELFARGMGTVFEQTLMVVKAQDQAEAQFAASTGAGREYASVAQDVSRQSAELAVTIGDSNNVMAALFDNMKSFSEISTESQKSVLKLGVTLDKLGVDGATTGQLLDATTKGFNLSIQESVEFTEDLAASMANLGLSVSKTTQAFVSALPEIAKYGKDSIKVFKNLAAITKATGVEIQSLLSISKGFDTFQGAAEKVGRLNAILGGNYLNSLELVNMQEADRILALREAIELSGKNFNELNRFEKQAIAAAAGISDMNEANKIFGLSAREYAENTRKAEENAEAQKILEERAKAAATAFEKLQAVLQTLAIFVRPIIDALHLLVDAFVFLLTLGGLVPLEYAGYVLLTISAALLVFFNRTKILSSGLGSLTKRLLESVKGLFSFSKASKAAGAALGSLTKRLFESAKSLFSFSKASKAAGAAQGSFTKRLFESVKGLFSFSKASKAAGATKGSFIKRLFESVKGLFSFSKASKAAGKGLGGSLSNGLKSVGKSFASFTPQAALGILAVAALAAALALLYTAVANNTEAILPFLGVMASLIGVLFVLGLIAKVVGLPIAILVGVFSILVMTMTFLVLAVKEFVGLFINNADKLGVVAMYMASISASAFSLALSGFVGALGIMALAGAFGLLALSLAFIKTADLFAMGMMFQGLGEIAKGGAGGLVEVRRIFSDVGDLESEQVEASVDIMNSMKELIITAGNASGNETAKILSRVANLLNQNNNQSTGETKVELYIDREGKKKIAEGIVSDISRLQGKRKAFELMNV